MLGGALMYYSFGSHMDGVAAPLDQNRGNPAAPEKVEGAHAAGLNGAHLSSSSDSGTKFRFGFLEFEDDRDAQAE
jgi:hypothetical protein